MITKELRLVITFDTTADAMAMETACGERGLCGRLIPVPTVVSAGCGLAWCADVSMQETMQKLIDEQGMKIHEMLLCVI